MVSGTFVSDTDAATDAEGEAQGMTEGGRAGQPRPCGAVKSISGPAGTICVGLTAAMV